MINILRVNTNKDMTFKLFTLKYNLRSCLILGIIDLFARVSVVAFNYFDLITLTHFPHIGYSITFLILWILSYLIFYFYGNKNSVNNCRIFFYTYIFPNFFIHTFTVLHCQKITTSLGLYPIFVLSTCLFFALPLWESVLLFAPTAVAFSIFLIFQMPKQLLLNVLLFNVVITTLLSFIYSILKYKTIKTDYNTRKMLLEAIEDRDATNEKLQLHEKYITDFFINISHDLKAPLNVIYSSEQLLAKQIYEKKIDYEKAAKYITSIKLNSIRLTRLLNNVLDISKIDAAKFSLNLRNLDIVTTIEGIADSLVDFMESRNITLSFDTEFEEMILALDEEKLERIVLNLLSNALKFTPPEGQIAISLYATEDFVFVSIKDTGMGIDEETQKNIFDRFVQGSLGPTNEMSGSGIGLSLVKSLMLLHGGDVALKSKLGEGSNFILKFKKTNIEETLAEDIANGSIYPNSNSSSATHLEFAGLVKETLKNNASL